ncbi:hydrolase [Archangium sp.]|uniref:hydrolase n=1 Tax=Archangium sp. TaxID=1872627 RepID=UPI00286A5273|nr:hydrolase [Archangium sp.]
MSVRELLDPSNCALVMIDYQPQMLFAVSSIDGQTLVNNTTLIAKAAKLFKVPTLLTSVATKTFSGPTFQQLVDVFPDQEIIDRTTMNAWEDVRVKRAVEKMGRKKLIFGGLWTSVCIAMPTLMALEEGYDVYCVVDACGDINEMVQESSVQRMVQAGVAPITSLQFLLELQRDWARQDSYSGVMDIVQQHAGTYGVGAQYARAFIPHASEAGDGVGAAVLGPQKQQQKPVRTQ